MPRMPNLLSPYLVAIALAYGVAGCSSSDGANDPAAPETDEGFGSDSGDPHEPDAPPGPGDPEPGGSTGAGEDGGSDLPPEPDDDGVDNSSESPEVCDTSRDTTFFLSPDDSNSMSSPLQVREAVLGDWGGVQSVAIRTWEFFNYYRFDYPAAEPGSLAITPSLMPTDPTKDDGDLLLQIGVSSEALTDLTRAPMSVTLVLDTSSSMVGEPMEMLQETSRAIAASLREGDTISIVTWATDNALVLDSHAVDGPDDPIVLDAIDDLEPGGGTDLHQGLVSGYALAQRAMSASDQTRRVVLVSDGGANVGITDIDLIAEHAGSNDEDGIYMVGVGVGDATSYHDDLMDAVTDAGKGASVFIGNADDAWSVFHDDFISTMAVAARDVRLRLDLPPGFEITQTSAEQVSDDPSEVEPQHLAPNDAMVFHQRIRTCAPQMLAADATIGITVQYRDAATFEPREVSVTQPIEALLGTPSAPLLKGAAVFQYAQSLKAYKKADVEGRSAAMDGAFAALDRAEAALPEDPDLAEIRAVLQALAER